VGKYEISVVNPRSEQSEKRNQPSTSSNLDDVPDQYWDEIKEQTGGLYTKANVDSLERVKQLLTDSSTTDLESELNDNDV
jgi:hypothetical protein